MKRRKWIAGWLFLSATLFSCSSPSIANDSDAYLTDSALTPAYHDGFKILQLTDIHWSFSTDTVVQKRFLDKVVSTAQPDLIILTGDQLLDANEELANQLYDEVDSWKIPYAITWGNHDLQGTWSPEWMSARAGRGKYSLYRELNDSLTGRSNYVINLKEGSTTKWQVYCIDSNSYVSGLAKYGYDYIRDDQVAFYEAQTAKAGNVPNALYFHIPLWEAVMAWKDHSFTSGITKEKGMLGEIHEKATYTVKGLSDVYGQNGKIPFWPGESHSGIFEAGLKHNLKAAYCGHDHSNDWGCFYQNVYLGYGVKSGRELYAYTKADGAAYDRTGGSIMTLHDGGAFELTHLFVDTDDLSIHTEVLS